jgi:toxin ParE1/3/4
MTIQLHPRAEEELYEVARWYEDQVPGLGGDLLTEVEHWLDVVPETPVAWPRWPGARKLDPPIRRVILERFPFAIAYQALQEGILVLAFAHTSRRPFYWIERANDKTE